MIKEKIIYIILIHTEIYMIEKILILLIIETFFKRKTNFNSFLILHLFHKY
jgi:hypothetical protein